MLLRVFQQSILNESLLLMFSFNQVLNQAASGIVLPEFKLLLIFII